MLCYYCCQDTVRNWLQGVAYTTKLFRLPGAVSNSDPFADRRSLTVSGQQQQPDAAYPDSSTICRPRVPSE
jgi:hypothetical protein